MSCVAVVGVMIEVGSIVLKAFVFVQVFVPEYTPDVAFEIAVFITVVFGTATPAEYTEPA